MTAADILVWGAILAFAVWAPYRLLGSIRRDRAWPERVRRFVQAHGLREMPAGSVRDSDREGSDWNRLRRWWVNPSLHQPAAGTVVWYGDLGGLPFFFDQVVFKRNNSIRIYVRMAVEMAGAPRSLEVSPAGRVRRLLRVLAPRRAAVPGRPLPRNLLVRYSGNPADRVGEQAFLTAGRLRALDGVQSGNGKVYLANRRLYLISGRHGGRGVDLEGMYADLDRIVAAVIAAEKDR